MCGQRSVNQRAEFEVIVFMFEIYNQQSPIPAKVTELYRAYGLPGLGPESRAGVLSESEISSQLNAALSEVDATAVELISILKSALLFWHDYLDPSHDISQNLHGADGSYLHGMMHRREPDYWNSKYWFRQSGNHPNLEALTERVAVVLDEIPWTPANAMGQRWDSSKFVDLVDHGLNRDKSEEAIDCLKLLQALEFETLLEYVWERFN